MSKFPLLEQLRAERERQEAEITAPLRLELEYAGRMVADLRATIREIERIVGSEIAKHVAAEIAHSLSGEVRRAIVKALPQVGNGSGVVTLHIPAEKLRFSDPKSVEREVLDRYINQSVPSLRLRLDAMPDAEARVTVMDVLIPELGFRRTVTQH